MNLSFEGEVVFVTGAASGIGLAIGTAFAENGADVVLSDLNEEKLSEQKEILSRKGFSVAALKCDVTKEQEINQAIDLVVEKYGKIDVLVNNAGLQHVSSIEEFPTEKFEQLIRVMLTAPFLAIKHVFPIMKKQGSGRILNMASVNGLIGFSGKAAYNSAKHGVIGLTKAAALEGAEDGITVNAICPGYVNTPLVQNQLQDLADSRDVRLEKVLETVIYPLVPQKRLLGTEEIADYAMYLASQHARGITGQAVVLDGGYTAQ